MWLTDVGAWWDVDLLFGNLAGRTLGDWALPAVGLQEMMDVDTGIFEKKHGSMGHRYKLFFCCCEAAESESAGRDQCCRMCRRQRDTCQEIGAHGGVAAEP